MYVDACEATHVRGEQSAEVLDLRMACLNERLDDLRALSQAVPRAPTPRSSRTPSAPRTRWAARALRRRRAPARGRAAARGSDRARRGRSPARAAGRGARAPRTSAASTRGSRQLARSSTRRAAPTTVRCWPRRCSSSATCTSSSGLRRLARVARGGAVDRRARAATTRSPPWPPRSWSFALGDAQAALRGRRDLGAHRGDARCAAWAAAMISGAGSTTTGARCASDRGGCTKRSTTRAARSPPRRSSTAPTAPKSACR